MISLRVILKPSCADTRFCPSLCCVAEPVLCECDHRADELIGLKVDVSGEFIAEFELVFVQEP